MTKLRRFPSLTGNLGNNNNDSNNAATGLQSQQTNKKFTRTHRHASPFQQRIIGRHVSPFRPQPAASQQRSTKSEQQAATTRRSKTPGRVRWFVNPGALVNSNRHDSDHNKDHKEKKASETGDANASVPDLTQTKTNDTLESETSSQMESVNYISMEWPTSTNSVSESIPSTPTRSRGDPEQTISLDTTPARSNRSSNTLQPLLTTTDTIELVASPSFHRTTADDTSSEASTPPDPEGLELWTTPTKPKRAALMTTSHGEGSSCGSEDDDDEYSRLLLFGDEDEDDTTQQTGTDASNGFYTAVPPSVESNTAEEAARGACEDLTAPRDVVNEVQLDSSQRQRSLENEMGDDIIINEERFGDEYDDDYTYTASLAPSAGFESVSPSYFYAEGGDPSIVEGQRLRPIRDDGESGDRSVFRATSPPKEVLTMTAEDGTHRNDNAEKKGNIRKGHSNIASKEEIHIAREMASNLLRELETVRGENERLLSRNRRLATHLHDLKVHQEEHLIYRSRLIKACLYVSPVFILCGGLDIFCITVLLVWVLVEVESYMDLGDEKAANLIEDDLKSVIFDKETDSM